MMQYKNFFRVSTLVLAAGIIFSACKKPTSVDEIGDRGQTFVKILNGGQADFSNAGEPSVQGFNVDFVPVSQKLTLADVRRDVPNNEELNKTMVVTVKDDTTALNLYNDSLVARGGTAFVYLPSNVYTIVSATPKTGGDGGIYTLTFAPGEFAKPIEIALPDATVLDPSTKYALAFTISTADAGGVVSYLRSVIVTIGAKNAYDGKYNLMGQFYHPSRSPDYHHNDWNVEMWTVGGDAVEMWSPDFQDFVHPFYDITSSNPGNINAFGGQSPRYTVNSVTNKVIVDNYYTGAATFYQMGLGYDNAGYDSHWDPATKTMYACFGYGLGPNGEFAPNGAAREWIDTLKYLGPR